MYTCHTGLTWKLSLGHFAGLVYTGLFAVQNPPRAPHRCWSEWSSVFGLPWAAHPAPGCPQPFPHCRPHNTLLPSSWRSTSSTWSLKKYRWPQGQLTAAQRQTPKISSSCVVSSVFTAPRRFGERANRPLVQPSQPLIGSEAKHSDCQGQLWKR